MSTDAKIEAYRNKHSGYLRLLALRIEQVPPELGELEQSVTVELLSQDSVRVLNALYRSAAITC